VRATGIVKEIGETLEMQGVMNTRRRRVTFILDYFSVLEEGEQPSSFIFVEIEVGD
jgi:hypothetical protein